MRARLPDFADHVERDGVMLGYEVYGDGDPTILLLPAWTIIHSRFWKMQIPYLSRHYRVIAYDAPGNGRSDRVTDPARYRPESFADDAAAVLDACGTDSAVVIGLSKGAQYGVTLASTRPDRVIALAMIGPALPVTPPAPARAATLESFHLPYPEDVSGWGKYNLAYWHDQYPDFARFFFEQCFPEPHSTKPIEDTVLWALQTGPDVLEADATPPGPARDWPEDLSRLRCPTLVIHGTGDRIQPHERGVETARLAGGSLVSMAGSGHIPNVRDPVKVNLILRRFIESVTR